MIILAGQERERLRQLGCDVDLIETLCYERPKWIDDLMMPYDDLAKPDSDLVQEALLSGCPVCNAQPGQYCQTVVTNDPLHEAFGDYVHMIRGDRLPYTKEEGTIRRPEKPKYPKASTEHVGFRAGGPNG